MSDAAPISPPETRSTTRRRPLWWLVVGHATLCLAAAVITDDQPNPPTAVFLAVVFCESALLGIWAGLGWQPGAVRAIGLCVGTYCLGLFLGWGIDDSGVETFFLVAIATLITAAVAWTVRLTKAQLQSIEAISAGAAEGLQFGIRHLLILMVVVAVGSAIAKQSAHAFRGADLLGQLAILALCYASVGLAALWATLGKGSPLVRSPFVIVVAVGAGLTTLALDELNVHVVFWIATTVMQAIGLTASLWIVRRAGYRLVSRSAVMAENARATR